MSSALLVWLGFAIAIAVIGVAGTLLSHYGDVLSRQTSLGGHRAGLLLLATVTSLPELATSLAAVLVADAPDIAVGNIVGACMFNLAMIGLLDFLHERRTRESVYFRAGRVHALSAAFALMLLGVVAAQLTLSHGALPLALGHVGVSTPVILVLYFVSLRVVQRHERRHRPDRSAGTHIQPGGNLRGPAARFAGAAALVIAAGIALPFLAERVAAVMGWHETFVGTLFVAFATTLPEMTVTITAIRIGAVDMAIGNLLGSVLFNLLILALADLAYLKGALLGLASGFHVVSVLTAMTMTGAVIAALLYKAPAESPRRGRWISVLLAALYAANAFVLFAYGD
jgi:cation:H+ antiporter